MKFFAAFAILLVGVAAIPQQQAVAEKNIITDQIAIIIENFSLRIREAGLDPMHIRRESAVWALPVPSIFSAAGFVEEFLLSGLSDIVINELYYDIAGFNLTFEVEMPLIHLSAETAAGEVIVFGNKVEGEISGSVNVRSVKVRGVATVGILGGVSVRSLDLDASIANIDSNVYINIRTESYNLDLSSYLNGFLNRIVPEYLDDFQDEINELLSIIVINYINENILG